MLGSSASLPATTHPAVPPLFACKCPAIIGPISSSDSPADNEVKTSTVVQKRAHVVRSASGEGLLILRHLRRMYLGIGICRSSHELEDITLKAYSALKLES